MRWLELVRLGPSSHSVISNTTNCNFTRSLSFPTQLITIPLNINNVSQQLCNVTRFRFANNTILCFYSINLQPIYIIHNIDTDFLCIPP